MAGQYARHFHWYHPPGLIQGVDRGAGQIASRRVTDRAQDRKWQPPRCCNLGNGATFEIDGSGPRRLPEAALISDAADHRIPCKKQIDRQPRAFQKAQQGWIAVVGDPLMQNTARYQRSSGVQARVKPAGKTETDQRGCPVIGEIFGHFPGAARGSAANRDGTAGTLCDSRLSDHAHHNTKTRNITLPP